MISPEQSLRDYDVVAKHEAQQLSARSGLNAPVITCTIENQCER